MEILAEALPADFCSKAAESLFQLSRGNVLICTGFYCHGNGETDGPLGAYFLCKALEKLGFSPYIVSDKYTLPFFDFNSQIQGFLYTAESNPKGILSHYNPVSIISIERCGRSADGNYYNMAKKNISDVTPKMDSLFIEAPSNCLTIGIGDGGNEIGMGNLYNIVEKLNITPSIIKTNHLIVATVSNWGTYGLLGELSKLSNINLLPEFSEVEYVLKAICSLGATDGIKGKDFLSVDGFELEYDKEILARLSANDISGSQ